MIDLARENRAQTDATQRTLLAESYYGLRLAQEIVGVRLESYKALKLHYENALKLESTGMIDKAARLFAQVNMDEALRELEAARKEEAVVQRTLKTLLNLETSGDISPSSPLFINDTLPPKMEFMQVVGISNYLLNQLSLQEHMAKQQVRIDQSGYLPNIALFRQTNSLFTWHTEQPVAPHHDRGRLHLEPFRRTGTGEANPAITPDTTNPCTGTGEST